MGAWPGSQEIGRGKPGADGRDTWHAWVSWTGVCSSSSSLPGLTHAEREERGRWEGTDGEADRGGLRECSDIRALAMPIGVC
jgi:hypothetical protein